MSSPDGPLTEGESDQRQHMQAIGVVAVSSSTMMPAIAATTTLVGSSAATDAPGIGSFAPHDSAPTSGVEPRHTRLQSGIHKPKVYTDPIVRSGRFTSFEEPRNVNEALGDQKWKDAMDLEYNAMLKNKLGT